MRYYVGLGVGHAYGWSQKALPTESGPSQTSNFEEHEPDLEIYPEEHEAGESQGDLHDAASINSIDRGLSFSDGESDGEGEVDADEVESEDEEFCAHYLDMCDDE